MTIKDFYDWACDENIEYYDLHTDDDIYNTTPVDLQFVAVDDNNRRVTITERF